MSAHASPGVRRFARELGVDVALVKGSGPKGRILKEDIQNFVKQALAGGLPAAAARGRRRARVRQEQEQALRPAWALPASRALSGRGSPPS